MKLVVDANILIAALIKDAATRELLLDDSLELVAPEHLLAEARHLLNNPRIRKRLKLNDDDLDELVSAILARISFIPEGIFVSSIKQALPLVAHPEDAPYAALALAFNVPIWSNDSALKEMSSARIKVITTTELIRPLA